MGDSGLEGCIGPEKGSAAEVVALEVTVAVVVENSSDSVVLVENSNSAVETVAKGFGSDTQVDSDSDSGINPESLIQILSCSSRTIVYHERLGTSGRQVHHHLASGASQTDFGGEEEAYAWPVSAVVVKANYSAFF